MMKYKHLPFVKYQSEGNDFILLDKEDIKVMLNAAQIKRMCDRRLGVGADGLIVYSPESTVYYNCDGVRAGFCGNGLRAVIDHLVSLDSIPVEGTLLFGKAEYSYIHCGSLIQTLHPIPQERLIDEGVFFLNTGVDHLVILDNDLSAYSVDCVKKLREQFIKRGFDANINVVREHDSCIEVLTFERGVEAFTHSCGSGALASAWVVSKQRQSKSPLDIVTPYGKKFSIAFEPFRLEGATQKVFEGVFFDESIKLSHLEVI